MEDKKQCHVCGLIKPLNKFRFRNCKVCENKKRRKQANKKLLAEKKGSGKVLK